MSGYKLFYFPARGAGEISRLSFAAANIEFEDILMDRHSEAWAKERASGRSPFDQLPFLVTPEGKALSQSTTLMKYICKKGGLCPSDIYDEAVADMICDSANDLIDVLMKLLNEKDDTKKEEIRKEFYGTTLPTRLEKFNALLKGPFFLGDKLTYADIKFFDLFNNIIGNGKLEVPVQLSKFPKLEEHYKKVRDVPRIKAWLEKRPETQI